MAGPRPRGSSIFSGLILLFIGLLLLLHNYRGFELSDVVLHWWPLVLIFWGAIKLYERTANRPAGQAGGSRITGGEVFLVLGLLAASTLRRKPFRRMRGSRCARAVATSPCALRMSQKFACPARST